MKMKLLLTGEEVSIIPVSLEKSIKFKDQKDRLWNWDQLCPLSTPVPSTESHMIQEVAHKISINLSGTIK